MPVSSSLLSLRDITKTYTLGHASYTVLHGVSLDIQEGEFVAIMGQSGSGKSTLMNIIGLLDTPTSGSYFFDGDEVSQREEADRTNIRRSRIGFVFQQYNLLSRMPAIKQVALPLMYQGVPIAEQEKRAREALEIVGLKERVHHLPNELSGGQQQRVSIARALVTRPHIILADEPTGALDSKTGQEVMELLSELNAQGKTIVLITHEKEIAAYAHRTIVISDGNIITET